MYVSCAYTHNFEEHLPQSATVSIMLLMNIYMLLNVVRSGTAFVTTASTAPLRRTLNLRTVAKMSSTSSTSQSDVATALSWLDLQKMAGETPAGAALNNESILRLEGKGSAHVQNKLRKFDSDDEPVITLFRDHAGW